MLAPTGKAAYNIKGNTIHSALAIPACQSLKNYKSLDSSQLNTLRCQIGGFKLIFLDEISMVGNTMFTVQIDNRLKDVKGSALPFGGVSIIAIGDLFQLQPVIEIIQLMLHTCLYRMPRSMSSMIERTVPYQIPSIVSKHMTVS